ncbi:MAG: aspartate kinase, partial [Myxococcota bacterium]|nr:aspartate kinase [Myxococcota bacterium]
MNRTSVQCRAMNPIVVHKYGGSSLADLDKIRRVATRIVDTVQSGKRVVVVVSAMGGTTDALLAQAKGVSATPNARELDMLLSVGERISTALLAIAVHDLGVPAVSFTGSQSGIITNTRHNRARIIEVRPYRLMDELDAGKVVIVAGYQGVSYAREITTLGRGGTDTTAVALAAALEAEYCEICSDVDGVYTADPRIVSAAERLDELDHGEMAALARSGARVLNPDCVAYASRAGVALFAKATFGPRDDKGTVIRTNPGVGQRTITAIAHRDEVARLVADASVSTERLLDVIAAVDALPSSIRGGGAGASTEILVALDDVHRPDTLVARIEAEFGVDVMIVVLVLSVWF